MYGIPVGGGYINYRFIDGNRFIYAVLLIMVLLQLTSYANVRKLTYTDQEKLIQDLQEDRL